MGVKVFPLVYVLCTNRRKKTYVKILVELKKIEPRLAPSRIVVDFENAFILAIERVFPDADIKGCLFHFGQCLWRAIQEHELQPRYSNDSDFALNLRMLKALSFVPEDYVQIAFDELIGSEFYVANADDLKPLLNYFSSTWHTSNDRANRRRGPTFATVMWNHYDSVIDGHARTNNAVEGWHNRFNKKAQACHLSMWKFIELLKSEQSIFEVEYEQVNAGAVPPPKKRKYRDLDARIENVVESFDPSDLLIYLRGIAQNLSL